MISWLFSEPNPIGVNTALAMLAAIKPVFRLPYYPLNQTSRQTGFELLQQLSESERIGNSLTLLQEEDFVLTV